MAQIFGQRSKYLIRMENINRIAAISIGTLLFFLVYEFFTVNFGRNIPLISWIIIFAMYTTAFYFIRKKGYKYIAEAGGYLQGRKGEYAIYFELLNLPDSFLVFQDVKFPNNHSNIDYVVVGPTGIFAVEVKSHEGKIGFNGSELMKDGRIIKEKDFLKQAMQEAQNLNAYILEKLNVDNFVFPLLVFSSPKAEVRFGLKSIRNVYVIQKGYLLDMITGCKPRLNSEEIEKMKVEISNLIYPNRLEINNK